MGFLASRRRRLHPTHNRRRRLLASQTTDRGLVWNTDLIETLELENLLINAGARLDRLNPDQVSWAYRAATAFRVVLHQLPFHVLHCLKATGSRGFIAVCVDLVGFP